MVSSVDGATTLEGVSGGLGGDGDRAVYRALRALADTVLVGASTVRAEHYQPPKKPGQIIAVVTASGDLDFTWPLFTGGHAVVVAPLDGPPVPVPAIRAGHGGVDLAAAVAQLPGDVVLAEGGPGLNGQLLAAGLVDEVCVTIAAVTVAGRSSRLAHGDAEHLRALHLAHLLTDDSGALYARYLTVDPD
jgi:riboflavin biosynthesis pyrimidine reductase